MKILFIHNGADLYGASRSCLRVASRLVADGNKVMVAMPFEGPLRAALAAAGVETVILEGMSLLTRQQFRSAAGLARLPFRVLCSTARIIRLIGSFNADIVHSNTGTVFLCGGLAARLRGRPHVWHIREDFGDFAPVWKLYRLLIGILSDRIVCISEFVSLQFGTGRLQKKIRVIHNGYARSEFTPLPEDAVRTFREAHGLAADGRTYIGLIGRINIFRKGHLLLVEAARIVRNQAPGSVFVIVGTPFPGNEEHLVMMRDRIRALDLESAFVFTGDVADVRVIYQTIDVLVQPSTMPEGLGGVVVEAMASGLPVVATKLGATPEIVADGRTGLLVPPDDPAALAAALLQLMASASLRRQMGIQGRERFETSFEFDSQYKKLLVQYSELAR